MTPNEQIIEYATKYIRKVHGAGKTFSHLHQFEGDDYITVYLKSTPIFCDTTDYHPCLYVKVEKK